MSDEKQSVGGSWAKMFHRSGLQVSVQFHCDPLVLMDTIDSMLEQGWLPNAPGVEPGEDAEEVAYVLHGEHEQKGETTPYILLYSPHDAMKWSFLKVWFNTQEQIDAFEAVSGLKLDALPLYIGQDKPERGKSKQIDKFIVKLQRPCKVILKQNPKWVQEAADAAKSKGEMYTFPKRVFVRWDGPKSTESKPTGFGLEDLGHGSAKNDIYEKAKNAILTCALDKLGEMQQLVYDRLEEGKLTNEQANELIGIAHARIPDTSKLF
jgi:hypothetical protein